MEVDKDVSIAAPSASDPPPDPQADGGVTKDPSGQPLYAVATSNSPAVHHNQWKPRPWQRNSGLLTSLQDLSEESLKRKHQRSTTTAIPHSHLPRVKSPAAHKRSKSASTTTLTEPLSTPRATRHTHRRVVTPCRSFNNERTRRRFDYVVPGPESREAGEQKATSAAVCVRGVPRSTVHPSEHKLRRRRRFMHPKGARSWAKALPRSVASIQAHPSTPVVERAQPIPLRDATTLARRPLTAQEKLQRAFARSLGATGEFPARGGDGRAATRPHTQGGAPRRGSGVGRPLTQGADPRAPPHTYTPGSRPATHHTPRTRPATHHTPRTRPATHHTASRSARDGWLRGSHQGSVRPAGSPDHRVRPFSVHSRRLRSSGLYTGFPNDWKAPEPAKARLTDTTTPSLRDTLPLKSGNGEPAGTHTHDDAAPKNAYVRSGAAQSEGANGSLPAFFAHHTHSATVHAVATGLDGILQAHQREQGGPLPHGRLRTDRAGSADLSRRHGGSQGVGTHTQSLSNRRTLTPVREVDGARSDGRAVRTRGGLVNVFRAASVSDAAGGREDTPAAFHVQYSTIGAFTGDDQDPQSIDAAVDGRGQVFAGPLKRVSGFVRPTHQSLQMRPIMDRSQRYREQVYVRSVSASRTRQAMSAYYRANKHSTQAYHEGRGSGEDRSSVAVSRDSMMGAGAEIVSHDGPDAVTEHAGDFKLGTDTATDMQDGVESAEGGVTTPMGVFGDAVYHRQMQRDALLRGYGSGTAGDGSSMATGGQLVPYGQGTQMQATEHTFPVSSMGPDMHERETCSKCHHSANIGKPVNLWVHPYAYESHMSRFYNMLYEIPIIPEYLGTSVQRDSLRATAPNHRNPWCCFPQHALLAMSVSSHRLPDTIDAPWMSHAQNTAFVIRNGRVVDAEGFIPADTAFHETPVFSKFTPFGLIQSSSPPLETLLQVSIHGGSHTYALRSQVGGGTRMPSLRALCARHGGKDVLTAVMTHYAHTAHPHSHNVFDESVEPTVVPFSGATESERRRQYPAGDSPIHVTSSDTAHRHCHGPGSWKQAVRFSNLAGFTLGLMELLDEPVGTGEGARRSAQSGRIPQVNVATEGWTASAQREYLRCVRKLADMCEVAVDCECYLHCGTEGEGLRRYLPCVHAMAHGASLMSAVAVKMDTLKACMRFQGQIHGGQIISGQVLSPEYADRLREADGYGLSMGFFFKELGPLAQVLCSSEFHCGEKLLLLDRYRPAIDSTRLLTGPPDEDMHEDGDMHGNQGMHGDQDMRDDDGDENEGSHGHNEGLDNSGDGGVTAERTEEKSPGGFIRVAVTNNRPSQSSASGTDGSGEERPIERDPAGDADYDRDASSQPAASAAGRGAARDSYVPLPAMGKSSAVLPAVATVFDSLVYNISFASSLFAVCGGFPESHFKAPRPDAPEQEASLKDPQSAESQDMAAASAGAAAADGAEGSGPYLASQWRVGCRKRRITKIGSVSQGIVVPPKDRHEDEDEPLQAYPRWFGRERPSHGVDLWVVNRDSLLRSSSAVSVVPRPAPADNTPAPLDEDSPITTGMRVDVRSKSNLDLENTDIFRDVRTAQTSASGSRPASGNTVRGGFSAAHTERVPSLGSESFRPRSRLRVCVEPVRFKPSWRRGDSAVWDTHIAELERLLSLVPSAFPALCWVLKAFHRQLRDTVRLYGRASSSGAEPNSAAAQCLLSIPYNVCAVAAFGERLSGFLAEESSEEKTTAGRSRRKRRQQRPKHRRGRRTTISVDLDVSGLTSFVNAGADYAPSAEVTEVRLLPRHRQQAVDRNQSLALYARTVVTAPMFRGNAQCVFYSASDRRFFTQPSETVLTLDQSSAVLRRAKSILFHAYNPSNMLSPYGGGMSGWGEWIGLEELQHTAQSSARRLYPYRPSTRTQGMSGMWGGVCISEQQYGDEWERFRRKTAANPASYSLFSFPVQLSRLSVCVMSICVVRECTHAFFGSSANLTQANPFLNSMPTSLVPIWRYVNDMMGRACVCSCMETYEHEIRENDPTRTKGSQNQRSCCGQPVSRHLASIATPLRRFGPFCRKAFPKFVEPLRNVHSGVLGGAHTVQVDSMIPLDSDFFSLYLLCLASPGMISAFCQVLLTDPRSLQSPVDEVVERSKSTAENGNDGTTSGADAEVRRAGDPCGNDRNLRLRRPFKGLPRCYHLLFAPSHMDLTGLYRMFTVSSLLLAVTTRAASQIYGQHGSNAHSRVPYDAPRYGAGRIKLRGGYHLYSQQPFTFHEVFASMHALLMRSVAFTRECATSLSYRVERAVWAGRASVWTELQHQNEQERRKRSNSSSSRASSGDALPSLETDGGPSLYDCGIVDVLKGSIALRFLRGCMEVFDVLRAKHSVTPKVGAEKKSSMPVSACETDQQEEGDEETGGYSLYDRLYRHFTGGLPPVRNRGKDKEATRPLFSGREQRDKFGFFSTEQLAGSSMHSRLSMMQLRWTQRVATMCLHELDTLSWFSAVTPGTNRSGPITHRSGPVKGVAALLQRCRRALSRLPIPKPLVSIRRVCRTAQGTSTSSSVSSVAPADSALPVLELARKQHAERMLRNRERALETIGFHTDQVQQLNYFQKDGMEGQGGEAKQGGVVGSGRVHGGDVNASPHTLEYPAEVFHRGREAQRRDPDNSMTDVTVGHIRFSGFGKDGRVEVIEPEDDSAQQRARADALGIDAEEFVGGTMLFTKVLRADEALREAGAKDRSPQNVEGIAKRIRELRAQWNQQATPRRGVQLPKKPTSELMVSTAYYQYRVSDKAERVYGGFDPSATTRSTHLPHEK